jgi:hypothetical protein
VATHTVAYLGQSRMDLLGEMIWARGDVDRINERGRAALAGLDDARLVGLMREGVEPSSAAALYGGRVALIECLIHQQDVRRPLGQLRTIPAERLRVSLTYARLSPVIGAARRTRGVRMMATDLDWLAGRAPKSWALARLCYWR